MAMIEVGGKAVKAPSAMTWTINDVSKSDAGRTQDATMHKNRIARKRTLALTWNAVTPEECHDILVAFEPEYVSIKYWDPLVGGNTTKTFYCGDQTAPVYSWYVGGKLYQSVSFTVVER